MVSAVLGLLLGCLAMSSAQVQEQQYAVLCQNNFNDEWKYVAPGSGCKRFINCYGQDYHGMLQCPETTLFNENTQACEYPLDFNCQEPFNENPDSSPSLLSSNSRSATMVSSAQVQDENYAVLCQNNFNDEWKYVAPGSGCKRFINCYGQDYHGMLPCPETTLFNENTQACQYPLDFNCQEPFNENPDCVTGVDSYNCSAFTYCYLNTQYNFSCNQDRYYSQSKLTCVYAEDLTEYDKLRCNFRNGR